MPRVSAKQKLVHLQILRAIAASLVVIDHAIGSLEFRHLYLGFPRHSADFLGELGVCAFFVLSGLIMVRQSSDRFGDPRSPILFLYHRILRIVPLYWMATLLMFQSRRSWHIPTPHARAQILLSLFFIPDYYASDYRLSPILSQGWTLNYEISFYALFAVTLLLPIRYGIGLLIGVLSFAITIGHNYPLYGVANFYTDDIIGLFAAGALIGFLETRVRRLPKFDLPVSPALLLALPAVWLLFGTTVPQETAPWSATKYTFSIAVVALCTLTVNVRPGWLDRTLSLLGDASYSTYLFHLWAYDWTIGLVLRIYARLHHTPTSDVAFIAAAVVAANLLGLAVHLAIERPITRALRRIPIGSRTAT